jgi:hypothetical protein
MTEEAKFEKVTRTAKILYGPRKLLLCGFPAAARAKFEDLLALSGLPDVPRVWAADGHAEAPILELFGLPDGSGADEPSGLPRAVIVGGITEAELIGLMGACRKSGMAPALWAVLTPVSEKWALRQLLEELARERDRLQQNKK